jgi:hypothetical protein
MERNRKRGQGLSWTVAPEEEEEDIRVYVAFEIRMLGKH